MNNILDFINIIIENVDNIRGYDFFKVFFK